MPIEIKELHIKINVNEGSNSKADKSPKENKAKLISASVEAMVRLLENKKER